VLPLVLFLTYRGRPAEDTSTVSHSEASVWIDQLFDSQFQPHMNLTFDRQGDSVSDVRMCVDTNTANPGSLQIMHRIRRETREQDKTISVVISAGVTNLSDMEFVDVYTCYSDVLNQSYSSFNASCPAGQGKRLDVSQCTKNLLSKDGLPENLRCRLLVGCPTSNHTLEVSASYNSSGPGFSAQVYSKFNNYSLPYRNILAKGCPNDYCSIGSP
jgi:hypothetical protein